MRNILILLVVFSLTGCSVLKESSRDESINIEKTENRDVLTETLQNTEIEIPAAVFEAIFGVRSIPDSVGSDTSKPPREKRDPVRITVKKKTKVKDKSITSVDSSSHIKTEEKVKKESKGLFGFSIGMIVGVGVLLVIGFLIIKKFVL